MIEESKLSARATVIRSLLERYHELTEPSIGTNGEKGNGDQPPQMPTTYTREVREVERLLGRLRSEEWRLWWHVSERYLRSSQSIKERRVERKVKGRGKVTTNERVVWTTYSGLVDHDLVNQGVEWLASHWGLSSEPMLPREVLVSTDARYAESRKA